MGGSSFKQEIKFGLCDELNDSNMLQKAKNEFWYYSLRIDYMEWSSLGQIEDGIGGFWWPYISAPIHDISITIYSSSQLTRSEIFSMRHLKYTYAVQET